jgi:P-type Cu+ transporter
MRDPVCGKTVEKKSLRAEYLGCAYYFCSPQCQSKFDENPRLYLSESAEGA